MNTLEEELKDEAIPAEAAATSKKNVRNQWNWVQVSGRIASDVEKKMVKEQTVLAFTLVFETLRKTDREGSHVNFIHVELWGKMADVYAPYLGKGIEILVSGELFQQRWVNKQGQRAEKYCISTQAMAVIDQTFRPN